MNEKKEGLTENDLIACAICGVKRQILGGHVIAKHGLTKQEYKERYPGFSLVSPNRINHIKDALIAKYGQGFRKGVRRSKEEVDKITSSIRKTFAEGRVSWSKGKHWDEVLGVERVNEINARRRKTLSKTHEEKRSKGQWKLPLGARHKSAWGGYREDLQMYVRSRWEANICRLLNYFKIPFAYEPQVFDLSETCYTPDLFLPEEQIYVEIKGWMDSSSLQKITLFNQVYPDIRLYLIDYQKYSLLEYLCKDLVGGWEVLKDMSYLNKIRRNSSILRDYTLEALSREDIVQIIKTEVNILDRTRSKRPLGS